MPSRMFVGRARSLCYDESHRRRSKENSSSLGRAYLSKASEDWKLSADDQLSVDETRKPSQHLCVVCSRKEVIFSEL